MIADLVTTVARRSDPVLSFTDTFGRLDLTGRVFTNWIYKTVSLLRDISAEVVVLAPSGTLHWRELACLFAANAAGVTAMIDTHAANTGQELHPEADSWVGVTRNADDLSTFAEADDLWVFDPAPLALETQVRPEDTDYISAVRSYPDIAPLTDGPITWIVDGTPITCQPAPTQLGKQGEGSWEATATSAPENNITLTQWCNALRWGHLRMGDAAYM